jgi:putative ABC transport system permease protein
MFHLQSNPYTWSLPLAGESRSLGGIEVPGHMDETGNPVFDADWSIVTPGYFALLNIPLLRGRDFTVADTESSRPVAIINETMAQRFWPRENPIGRHFLVTRGPGAGKQAVEIIEVARNHKYCSLAAKPVLFVHVPMRQNYLPEMTLLVRADPAIPVVAEARSVLREINPYLPLVHAQPLREYAQLALFPQRLAGSLAWSLGVLGLLLTSMGIYRVTAFFVAQRTREIGIRMALGAGGRDVLRMVLWQGLRLTAAGMIAGLGAALAVTRLFSDLLIGIGVYDPITFLAVPLLLGLVAAAATWVPALRATRIEPMRALRHE